MKKPKEKNSSNEILKWVKWALLIVLILWGLNFLALLLSNNDRGVFGDMFGGVNALFSGLAFAGIIITIYMQKKELSLQREELKETREVFELQSTIMKDQQNDNTFFNLLSNHRQLVESFKTGRSKRIGKSKMFSRSNSIIEVVSGYEVLKSVSDSWYAHFMNYSSMYNTGRILDLGVGSKDPIKIMKEDIDTWSLFEELCHIHSFINNRFDDEKQAFYTSTLWKNLSYDEKFIFESIYANFSHSIEDIKHDIQLYNQYNFVDFLSCKIPVVNISTSKGSNTPHTIEISYDSQLVSCEFIMYRQKNDEIEIFDVIEIDPLSETDRTQFNLEDYLIRSKLDLDNFHHSKYRQILDHKFAVKCNLNKNNKEFNVLFENYLEARIPHQPEKNDLFTIYSNGEGQYSNEPADLLLSKLESFKAE